MPHILLEEMGGLQEDLIQCCSCKKNQGVYALSEYTPESLCQRAYAVALFEKQRVYAREQTFYLRNRVYMPESMRQRAYPIELIEKQWVYVREHTLQLYLRNRGLTLESMCQITYAIPLFEKQRVYTREYVLSSICYSFV